MTEAVEMRPVRRSLRDSHHAVKESAAAVSDSKAGSAHEAPKDLAAAAVSTPLTGMDPEAAKEPAASLSGSTQTANPQATLKDAAATSSQARKEQDALKDAETTQAGSQRNSAQAEGTDGRRALSKSEEGVSRSGQDRQPVVSMPGSGSGQMQGSATGSTQPADGSQTAQGQGVVRIVTEESQIGSGAGCAAEKEASQEQLPKLQKLDGQPGASEAQGHTAALVDTSLQQLEQGQATGRSLRPKVVRFYFCVNTYTIAARVACGLPVVLLFKQGR